MTRFAELIKKKKALETLNIKISRTFCLTPQTGLEPVTYTVRNMVVLLA